MAAQRLDYTVKIVELCGWINAAGAKDKVIFLLFNCLHYSFV